MNKTRGKKKLSLAQKAQATDRRKVRAVKRITNVIALIKANPPPLPGMYFVAVEDGAPDEGNLILVRLNNNTYRFGMVLNGFFAGYDHHSEEFVTFPHPERMTHWMKIIPPAAFSPAKAEAQTPKAEFFRPEDAGLREEAAALTA